MGSLITSYENLKTGSLLRVGTGALAEVSVVRTKVHWKLQVPGNQQQVSSLWDSALMPGNQLLE